MEHFECHFLKIIKNGLKKVIYWSYGMSYRILYDSCDLESKDVVGLVTKMFTFMAEFESDVQVLQQEIVSNYLDMNLPLTKIVAKRFLDNTLKNITEEHLVYQFKTSLEVFLPNTYIY